MKLTRLKSLTALPALLFAATVLTSAGAVQISAAATTSTTKVDAPNMMKGIFPVGVWFDGRVEGINCDPGFHNVPKDMTAAREYYERNFQDIKDHNIDIVVIPNTPPDYRKTLLTAADKIGVKIVLELVELAYVDFGGKYSVRNPQMTTDTQELHAAVEKIITPLKDHKSLFCYQVLDEPPQELFDNFARAKDALEKLDPAHPAFSCLCIEEELPRTAAMGTQMVIFDRYPLHKGMEPGTYDFKAYQSLLDNLDKHSGDLPYWNVIQTFGMDREKGVRYPTAAEVRVMTWLSLAHNAKGIFWFLHNSYTQSEKLQGLVDLEMKPHPIYAEVSDLSVMLKKHAPLLLRLERTKDADLKPQAGFDVQSFRDEAGKRYAVVVNVDVLQSAKFAGVFENSPGTDSKEIKDIVGGRAVPLTEGRFDLEIPAGGGVLLQL